MNNLLTLAGGVVLGALVVGIAFMQGQTDVQVVKVDSEPLVGSFAGPDVYDHMNFKAGVTTEGVFTLATTTNVVLRDSWIKDVKVISLSAAAPGAAPAMTLTTPASSTWSSLPTNGASQVWIIDNLHTAAATTSTLTAGTGVDIDGTTANDDVINGGVSATLECWKLPSSNVRCVVQEMVDAG